MDLHSVSMEASEAFKDRSADGILRSPSSTNYSHNMSNSYTSGVPKVEQEKAT